MTGAAKIPTGATRLDVMIAALRKQNDALVAALDAQTRWLHLASQNSGTDPHIRERHQQEAAIGEAALEQVK